MNAKSKIINAIRQSFDEQKKISIDLREASTLTGSGADAGGRTQFDDAFAALRYSNPFRMGARNIKTPNRSAVQFVAKTGNAANSTNPWGYTFTPNSGSPNVATSIWQLPTRVLTAQLPIRTAAMDDINAISDALMSDLALEFSQLEGQSMAINNDQSGSTTTSTGATDGLRGLDMYLSGTAAYGTSGTAITNGIHTIVNTSLGGVTPTYNKIVDIANSLPAVYWSMPGTAWHMTPTMIQTLRQLKDTSGLPLFLEFGEAQESAAVGSIFGWSVIPNPYLSSAYPIYLANWENFLTIADVEEMNVQVFDQTAPGYLTLFAEKRLVSTVRSPFAGVRASAA